MEIMKLGLKVFYSLRSALKCQIIRKKKNEQIKFEKQHRVTR